MTYDEANELGQWVVLVILSFVLLNLQIRRR